MRTFVGPHGRLRVPDGTFFCMLVHILSCLLVVLKELNVEEHVT